MLPEVCSIFPDSSTSTTQHEAQNNDSSDDEEREILNFGELGEED